MCPSCETPGTDLPEVRNIPRIHESPSSPPMVWTTCHQTRFLTSGSPPCCIPLINHQWQSSLTAHPLFVALTSTTSSRASERKQRGGPVIQPPEHLALAVAAQEALLMFETRVDDLALAYTDHYKTNQDSWKRNAINCNAPVVYPIHMNIAGIFFLVGWLAQINHCAHQPKFCFTFEALTTQTSEAREETKWSCCAMCLRRSNKVRQVLHFMAPEHRHSLVS